MLNFPSQGWILLDCWDPRIYLSGKETIEVEVKDMAIRREAALGNESLGCLLPQLCLTWKYSWTLETYLYFQCQISMSSKGSLSVFSIPKPTPDIDFCFQGQGQAWINAWERDRDHRPTLRRRQDPKIAWTSSFLGIVLSSVGRWIDGSRLFPKKRKDTHEKDVSNGIISGHLWKLNWKIGKGDPQKCFPLNPKQIRHPKD